MKLEEILAAATASARMVKAARVERGRGVRGECELFPTVLILRGHDIIALAQAGHVDRDESLAIAHMSAIGFDADALVHATDTWQPTPEHMDRSPVTGQAWGHGDMQLAVDEYGALEKGWITEGLTMFAINRAGDIAVQWLPYLIHDGPAVEWGEPIATASGEEGAEIGGVVVDALREAMDTPSISTRLAAAGEQVFPDDEPEVAQTRKDLMVCRLICERVPGASIVLTAPVGSPREAAIIASGNVVAVPSHPSAWQN